MDKYEILKLETGQCYIVPESDYGKAEIWRINNMYFVFEIPMYGGKPVYSRSYKLDQIDKMIYWINEWS